MNQKTCNPEGLKAYPEAVRDLPYCNWWYEEVKEQLRKVPYNSITGAKASSSRIETMTTLEKALAVVDRYDGVIVKVSGKVGFIDIDKCVREDGSLDERAQKILELLPGAMVEYSPSGKGLHVIFLVPEGFVFDRDEYFVNNKEIHVENYFPGYNNQLMTMTGNLYREGSMDITIEQLMLFEESFMKRPEQPFVPSIPLPEGGSILTDEEVFLKASHSSTGQKFVDYYNGEWEKYGGDNPNWSQSEADLGFCSMLAFYCRGDMEQMDRIFRESGLMRDKWDERRVGSTYGRNTMRKAIAGCKAFYEKGYHADAKEDFSDLPEDEAEEETLIRQQAIDALLAEKDCSVDRALSPEYISHAAWAYLNDTARYVKLKGHIPKEVGARAFEREVQRQVKEKFANNTRKPVERLMLKGITVRGILVPENWIVDDTGIRHMEMVFGELKPVPVSAEPLFISSKLVNVDDGTEKLETTYRRNGKYKKLIAPRADMLNRNAIIKYADDGFPVSSGTASRLTSYISEMEAVNNRVIPIQRSIRRAGWVGDEFFPYSLKGGIVAQSDGSETERLLEALHKQGDEAVWMYGGAAAQAAICKGYAGGKLRVPAAGKAPAQEHLHPYLVRFPRRQDGGSEIQHQHLGQSPCAGVEVFLYHRRHGAQRGDAEAPSLSPGRASDAEPEAPVGQRCGLHARQRRRQDPRARRQRHPAGRGVAQLHPVHGGAADEHGQLYGRREHEADGTERGAGTR